MKTTRTPLNRLLRRAGLIALAPVLLFATAALAGALVTSRPFGEDGPQQVKLHLLPGPIHTDLLLPLDTETRAAFAWLEPQGIALPNPQAQWLVVGWRARAFYMETATWRDLKTRTVWKAITGADAHAIRTADRPGVRQLCRPAAHGRTWRSGVRPP